MAAHERFAAATPDPVEAIFAGIGDFAAEVYAPLNRPGDTNNPKWNDGRVTMPSGFKDAYRQFVAAGWGSIDGTGAYGGHDLRLPLALAVCEAVGRANHGFSLFRYLTPRALQGVAASGAAEKHP